MSRIIQATVADAQDAKPAEPDWSLGWRYELVRNAYGQETAIRIPLTPEEARHPKEGYVMPERTEHEVIGDDLADMLRGHFEEQPAIAVFRNLVFEWDQAEVKSYAPDVAVVPHVRDRDANRGHFAVGTEGTRPILAIEIVSPTSREADRVLTVKDYALVGIREYVYIDIRTRRGVLVGEVAGFRLDGAHYLPILPDEDDAIYLESVQLRIGLDGGRVWLEDATTGEDLLNNLQVRRAWRTEQQARQAAEDARQSAEARAQAAEAQIAELQAQLKRLQQRP